MLTPTQITNNKNIFLSKIEELKKLRPDNDWYSFINFLETSDFFTAPASTMFHSAFEGGLCEHSLRVCDCMLDLVNTYKIDIDKSSILLVSLLHDISKTNMYVMTPRNKKVYYNGTDDISKYDKMDSVGRFGWFTELNWSTKDVKDTFTYGNHEESSVFILQNWLALSTDEIIAILHHSGIYGDKFDDSKRLSYVYSKYPLAILLHLADESASFLFEGSALLGESTD